MDAIRLHSDGTLSSEAPFARLLRMRLELDGDVTLRSFFRLLKRNPLARELVPGLGDALAEAEACPASGCRYPGLEALRLGKRGELTGFPRTPRVDGYLAVAGGGAGGDQAVQRRRHHVESEEPDVALAQELRLAGAGGRGQLSDHLCERRAWHRL